MGPLTGLCIGPLPALLRLSTCRRPCIIHNSSFCCSWTCVTTWRKPWRRWTEKKAPWLLCGWRCSCNLLRGWSLLMTDMLGDRKRIVGSSLQRQLLRTDGEQKSFHFAPVSALHQWTASVFEGSMFTLLCEILFGWVIDVMQCDDLYAAFLRGTSRPMRNITLHEATRIHYHNGGLAEFIVVLSRWVVNLVCCFWLSRKRRPDLWEVYTTDVYKHTLAVDFICEVLCLFLKHPLVLCPVSNFCFFLALLSNRQMHKDPRVPHADDKTRNGF